MYNKTHSVKSDVNSANMIMTDAKVGSAIYIDG